MIEILQQAVFGLGLFTALLLCLISVYFFRLKSYCAPAFGLMCLAESIAALMTTFFSLSSVFGVYANLSPELVLTMRLLIFGPLLTSSFFLLWKVRNS